MTTAKDRAFDRNIRAYMRKHNVPYTVARRALRELASTPDRSLAGRIAGAATAAGVPATVDAVADAMLRFAGLPVPAPGPSRQLVTTLITTLDAVSVAPQNPHDLLDATDASDAPRIPPIPDEVRAALGPLDSALNTLNGQQLRNAARELAVSRGDVLIAIHRVHRRVRAAGAVGRPLFEALDDDETLSRFTTATIAALENGPADDQTVRAVLRDALRSHLAPAGDVLLRLSAWPAAELSWADPPAGTDTTHLRLRRSERLVAVAYRPVPGAPEPLQARISFVPDDDHDQGHQPFHPGGPNMPVGYFSWSVGWVVDGHFVDHNVAGAPTRELAELAAASYVHELLRDTSRLTAPMTGRLLVPRQGKPTQSSAVRQVRLTSMLHMLVDEHISEYSDGSLPAALPHQDAENGLNCAGILLDRASLPLPDVNSSANRAHPNDPAFLRFFHANGILISSPTLVYLAALVDASPAPASLAQRHTTAWQTLLAAPGSRRAAAKELGKLPSGVTVDDLGDVDMLARWCAHDDAEYEKARVRKQARSHKQR